MNTRTKHLGWTAIAVLALFASSLSAQVVVSDYAETGNLPANDDNSSDAIGLGFSISFAGQTYSQTYVSNNGYITFGSGSGSYDPQILNSDYDGLPIIAAFYSDVDTRSSSEYPGFNSGIVSWGTGTVDGHNAFEVKWPAVGEYSFVANYNSFSLVLVDRSDQSAGSFDVYLNYQQINWDQSESSENSAVVGFAYGDGTHFYQLPGSGTSGALVDGGANALTGFTNAGAAGAFQLQSRDGTFADVAEIVPIPEPSTFALLALGAGLIGLGYRRRRA